MKKLISVISVLVLALGLSACPVKPENVRDAIASSKGYLDAAKQHHPECATGTQSATCTLISKGVTTKDTAIDALNVYCASPSYDDQGGPCIPNKDLEPKLKAAIRDLNQIMLDVKKIGG